MQRNLSAGFARNGKTGAFFIVNSATLLQFPKQDPFFAIWHKCVTFLLCPFCTFAVKKNMLIGHYGPAFMIKAINKRVPLWMLFIAVQIPDILWGTFILTGIERATINTTLSSNPLQLDYMPYSHGLLSTLIYSLLLVGILMLFPRFRKQKAVAWWLGAAVFSHWLLDFLSHRPDLPVYGNQMKIGLGLWNYPTLAVIIELGIFLIGAVWYAIAVKGFNRAATWVFWGFVAIAILVSCFRGDAMGPVSARSVAASALVFYLVATLIILFVEKREKSPC